MGTCLYFLHVVFSLAVYVLDAANLLIYLIQQNRINKSIVHTCLVGLCQWETSIYQNCHFWVCLDQFLRVSSLWLKGLRFDSQHWPFAGVLARRASHPTYVNQLGRVQRMNKYMRNSCTLFDLVWLGFGVVFKLCKSYCEWITKGMQKITTHPVHFSNA